MFTCTVLDGSLSLASKIKTDHYFDMGGCQEGLMMLVLHYIVFLKHFQIQERDTFGIYGNIMLVSVYKLYIFSSPEP